MEFLWTDKCYLLVLFMAAVSIGFSLRKEPTRHSFKKIFRRPLAMSAGVVLLFFLSISILDSVHIHYTAGSSVDAKSREHTGTLLDYLLFPLGAHFEKSYVAPMALTLFSSETRSVNGTVLQYHPPIRYSVLAGKGEQAKRDFIYQSIATALGKSLLVLLISYLLLTSLTYWRTGRFLWLKSASARASCFSFALSLFMVLLLYTLSRELHVFGTGKIGQDILYYAVKSIRTGLVIGILTTLIMLPLALILGIAAGYFGGIIDDVIQYIYTTLSSIPGVLLITASVLSMQTFIANHPEYFPTLAASADARLFALCLILGVTSWTSLCRLLRAEVLKLREVDYVQAAIALGSRSSSILMRHLLPNVMHIVVITLVLDFSFLVLAEAVLSYVGVGVSPMTISWGNMINGARLELAREPVVWWPMLAAFIFMFTLVLCGNLFADAVRDAFDPHHVEH